MPSTRGTPARRPPGAVPGAVLGLAAGGLVVATWLSNPDVGFAVAVVFAGLIVCLVWGAPGWRSFGTAFLAGALVGAAALGAVFDYGASSG